MACPGDPIECGFEAALGLAEARLEQALRIVSEYCVESNDVGGIDATDLAFRFEQAGYKLPD
jgi:hypothetical protein